MTPTIHANEPAPTEAEGSRRHFHHDLHTSAPPAAVWALWTDVETWPRWDTELSEAVMSVPMALGARGELVSGGRTSSFSITVWEPPRRYAFATRLPFGRLVVTRTLEPLDDGGTAFTHDVRFTGVGGAVLAPMLGGRFRAELPGVMERLRALAEGR